MTKAKAKPPEQADPLDVFVADVDHNGVHMGPAIMLMLWKQRHENPDFTVMVDAADIKGFEDCVKYLEIEPRINIYRPQGLPAQEPIPANGRNRAVPGRAAQPPRDYVVVQMVDADGNTFVPIENNERDLEKSQKAKTLKQLREGAPQLAAQLQADIQSNTISTATIQEAIEALKALAQAK